MLLCFSPLIMGSVLKWLFLDLAKVVRRQPFLNTFHTHCCNSRHTRLKYRFGGCRAVLTPGVKGLKTSCFRFAEHIQCDARVDGRGQQSTHASMPRAARRTRIRTGTVRRAARRGRKRKSCCHAYTDVSVERRALTREGFVERYTCASVDIRGDRRILASADARHLR